MSNNNEETTVQYTSKTRPADSQLIPLNEDAFKFDKQGKERVPRSAQQRKYTAINYIVNTLTNEKFQKQYTPEQIVLALHEASKRPQLRIVLKSAGMTDVENIEAMKFHNIQMHRMLETTNSSKRKSTGTDDV